MTITGIADILQQKRRYLAEKNAYPVAAGARYYVYKWLLATLSLREPVTTYRKTQRDHMLELSDHIRRAAARKMGLFCEFTS